MRTPLGFMRANLRFMWVRVRFMCAGLKVRRADLRIKCADLNVKRAHGVSESAGERFGRVRKKVVYIRRKINYKYCHNGLLEFVVYAARFILNSL